jgi:Transport and Golgi organisation 2
MCTAILDLAPGAPVLLAGVRDELVDRAWEPPGRHWPDHPGLTGGRDLLAGGTWLAVSPQARRVTCVLNARGRPAEPASRRTRGVLPLEVAGDGKLSRARLADFDPFHVLSAEPGMAMLWSWDGEHLTERELGPGLHMLVNSGLASELLRPNAGSEGADNPGREHELARLRHFLPRLTAAGRPDPHPGTPVTQAWGAWLPLIDGDGLGPDDPRALIVRRDLGDGRIWGTTSVSLVAVWPDAMRYDFTAAPGNRDAWYNVLALSVPRRSLAGLATPQPRRGSERSHAGHPEFRSPPAGQRAT